MAKPRVFISSTYYDLKHVRASLEVFVESLGYEPILSEVGSIAYDPSQPLDESCYREARSSDIFVLIVGGRYGSLATSQGNSSNELEDQFESITRREFSRAHESDVPVYVLIDNSVHAEYQTYLRNKENKSINYAHVDSQKVFNFIEYIYSKQRNNPISSFEKGSDIEYWLRDQWAGYFQELLRQRKDGGRISDLSSQIRQLEAVNSTLKSYLESVLQQVSPEDSGALIERENESISRTQMIERAKKNDWFDYIYDKLKLDAEVLVDFHKSIKLPKDIKKSYQEFIDRKVVANSIIQTLKTSNAARKDFCDLMLILGQSNKVFSDESVADALGAIQDDHKGELE